MKRFTFIFSSVFPVKLSIDSILLNININSRLKTHLFHKSFPP